MAESGGKLTQPSTLNRGATQRDLQIGFEAYEEQKFLHLQQKKDALLRKRADVCATSLDYVFTAVVVANVAVMAVETDRCASSDVCGDFSYIETVFLIVYILELAFRLGIFAREARRQTEEEESNELRVIPSASGGTSYVEAAKHFRQSLSKQSKSFKMLRSATAVFTMGTGASLWKAFLDRTAAARRVLILAITDSWFVLDFSLVMAGVFDVWILPATADDHESSPQIQVLRLLRILRLVKVVRYFPQLWLLVNGMISSAKAVLWLWLLMCGFVFANALLLTRALAPSQGEVRETFGSMSRSVESLWRIITMDDWYNIAQAVLELESSWFWYFLFVVVVGNFFTLSVFTAIVVQTTSAVALNDDLHFMEEMKVARRDTVLQLNEFFSLADSDGNGQLTLQEFRSIVEREDVLQMFREMQIGKSDIEWLFSILDGDESGDIAIKEFVSGILKVKDSELTRGLLQLQYAMSTEFRKHKAQVNSNLEVQNAVRQSVREVLDGPIQELRDEVKQLREELRSRHDHRPMPPPLPLRSEPQGAPLSDAGPLPGLFTPTL